MTKKQPTAAPGTKKCPHTTKGYQESACSQCLGIEAKVIRLTLAGATIDGVPVRPVVPPQTWKAGYRKSAQRGGRATARRTGNV